MGRISERLASLHYTTWNLVVLLLWMVWGMLMAGSDSLKKAFNGMNNVLIRDWLTTQNDFPMLKIWFIGLCILMTFLGINLIFCSWEKIFRIIRARFNGSKFFMLIVHAIFGLVALFHLGGLMLGYEHTNIQLGEGSIYGFEDDYEIGVTKVNYVSDYSVLEKQKKDITRDDFDYRKNYAEVVLKKDGTELKRGNISIFNPMDYGDIQVTLGNFMKSPESGNKEGGDQAKPWIILTVSSNPVLDVFLVLYPLMIVGIIIHLIMTWRPSAKNREV